MFSKSIKDSHANLHGDEIEEVEDSIGINKDGQLQNNLKHYDNSKNNEVLPICSKYRPKKISRLVISQIPKKNQGMFNSLQLKFLSLV